MKPRYVMTRAVAYRFGPDGVDVAFLQPWNGVPRLDQLPWGERLKARLALALGATPVEYAVLTAAAAKGRDLHAAVLDDLACQRAAQSISRDSRFEREAVLQEQLLTPAWLKPMKDFVEGPPAPTAYDLAYADEQDQEEELSP